MDIDVKGIINKKVNDVSNETVSRAYRASNVLRNAALNVLRGKRSGRIYRVPFSSTKYQASAPGEPPAQRTGILRQSWRTKVSSSRQMNYVVINPAITTDVKYAPWLQDGVDKGIKKAKGNISYHLTIKPRPFKEPIIEMAKPQIEAIMSEPYNI